MALDPLPSQILMQAPPPEGAEVLSVLDDEARYQAERAAEEQRQQDANRVRELMTKFVEFKTERESYYDEVWNECYRTYRLQVPDERKSGEWRSKINVPHAFSNVEDVVPHIMEPLFGPEKSYKLEGEESDRLMIAYGSLLRWQTEKQQLVEQVWEDGTRSKAIYGTSAFYTGYRSKFSQRKRWQVARSTEQIGQQAEEAPVMESHEVPEYVGSVVKELDIYSLYPHPRATPDRIRELFWVRRMTMEEMKATGFKNLEMVKDSMCATGNNLGLLNTERQYRTGSANDQPDPGKSKTYWVITYFDDENKKTESFLANGDILLESGDYPFWHNRLPITFDRYTRQSQEFWGVGAIEPTLSLIHENNAIRNMRRDNDNLTSNAILEVRIGDIEDEEDELELRPGGVIHSNSGQATRFLQPPPLQGDSYQEEALVARDIARAAGMDGTLSGQPESGASNASAMNLRQKAQLLRLKRAIRNSAVAYQEVIQSVADLTAQFMPLSQVYAVLGPKFFAGFTMQDAVGVATRARVVVLPAGIYENEDVLRQQYTNFLNIVFANPMWVQRLGQRGSDILLSGLMRRFDIDPEEVLGDGAPLDMGQVLFAMQENQQLVAGQPVPPAQPEDNYKIHVETHRALLELRPDLWGTVGAHLQTHEQAMQMGQLLAMQQQLEQEASGGAPGRPNGPGSAPTGARGGVNPNRQPQPTSADSITKQGNRMGPKK